MNIAADKVRLYCTWTDEVQALIFLAATPFMTYHPTTKRRVHSLAGFLMILVGLVIYRIAQVPVPQVPVPLRQVSLHNEPN